MTIASSGQIGRLLLVHFIIILENGARLYSYIRRRLVYNKRTEMTISSCARLHIVSLVREEE